MFTLLISPLMRSISCDDFLSNIGCDIIQGYYYAEPMSVDNFEEILKKYPYREVMKGKFGSDNDI